MDNNPLIEAIAVALSNEQGRTTFLKMAQAALAAIANSGTHAVVPKEPTDEMMYAGCMWVKQRRILAEAYAAMISAAALAGRKP